MANNTFKTAILLFAVCLLTACASRTERIERRTATVDNSKGTRNSTVSVQTGDPKKLVSPLLLLNNEDFKASIEKSITRSKIFKGVIQGTTGDYLLEVRVISGEQPLAGITFPTNLEVIWILTRVKDRKVILSKIIFSEGDAGLGDSLIGGTRSLLALDRAVRENISLGLSAIAESDL